MQYSFLDQADETLIEASQLPTENGIALAMHTTGLNASADEVVELVICDLDGQVLFNQRVKPQNVETWDASEASGGLSPADVEDAPELFQFEEELADLFAKSTIVVAQHLPFAITMIETGWITLPEFEGFDIIERFRLAHSSQDYPGEAATVATLPSIENYYGIEHGTQLCDEAMAVAQCYRAFVAEHAQQRAAKGEAYWAARDERLAEENAQAQRTEAAFRLREHRLNQMNGLLWFSGAIIFISLAIQLYQRGTDMGLIAIIVAAAVFTASRGFVNFRK